MSNHDERSGPEADSSRITSLAGERIDRGGRKTALVCAGGGLTGAFYEIGALRALNDFMDGTLVTDFDLFVGTSSGAFIAACLANGISPEEMFRSLHTETGFLSQLKRAAFFHPNYSEVWKKLIGFPRMWIDLTRNYLAKLEEMTYLDYLLSFLDALPSGILTNEALERHFKKIFSRPPFVDRFSELQRELYITAVDIDAGERMIFGSDEAPPIPISKAIRAASALPVVYKPVRIDGMDFVDGVVNRTLNVDIAIERGADLIFVINPLVPLHNTEHEPCVPLARGMSQHVSTKGLTYVADQILRLALETRTHYGMALYRQEHPDVDILLIQPEPSDFKMFFYRYFQYSYRMRLVEHGFSSARNAILGNFDYWRQTFDRHGIRLSRGLVEYELQVMARAQHAPSSDADVEATLSGRKRMEHDISQLERRLGLVDEG